MIMLLQKVFSSFLSVNVSSERSIRPERMPTNIPLIILKYFIIQNADMDTLITCRLWGMKNCILSSSQVSR